MLPTGASSKSPNRASEQYNAMDGSFEHTEQTQGLHGEENDNTDSACVLQVENALVSSSSFSCLCLDIKSRPINLRVVSIVRLGSSFLYLYPSQIAKGTLVCSSVWDLYV